MIDISHRKSKKKFLEDKKAAVGIGTLIIFIAMVLVAAVAAAVLINTSGILQQKAQQTGKETIAQVSSNLMVETIVGEMATAGSTNLDTVKIYISPNAGAGRIDLNQTVVKISNGLSFVDNLTYDTSTSATKFTVTELRDADNSCSSTTPVINSGDLVYITVDVSATGINMAFPVRKPMHIELVPEVGQPVIIDLNTPASYGVDTVISLYP